jgi:hypothetical protein
MREWPHQPFREETRNMNQPAYEYGWTSEVKETYARVRTAIENRVPIRGEYKGHVREMCPHVIGTKNGRANALFYQFGGTSSSRLEPDGSPNNWRCIHLDELHDVTVFEGTWHTAPNHSRPQTCVDEIDLEVA